MKKLTAILLVLVMMLGIAACTPATTENPGSSSSEQTPPASTAMTHAEYLAAAEDDAVEVECYVQATQSWWDNKIVIYAQDKEGGYFAYNVACTEEDAAKLVPGTKINIKGFKTFYKGMPEIADGATFTVVEGADTYKAEATDMTSLLGKQELVNKAGMLAAFKGLTVEGFSYQNDTPGKDIYLNLKLGEASYSFCVESYLTGADTDVYKAVSSLKKGDVVHVEGFLYWYEGVNTHITAVYNGGVLSYEEYAAAKLNQHVKVEAYVQATQSWWDNKITVYAADEDGAYFIYELACSEEDAAKLVPGTKILVDGYKGEWAGEVEIMDATFTFVDGDPYVAEAKDLTDVLGTDELINYQNQLVSFAGLTVVKIDFKNGEPGDDIYVTLSNGDNEFSFCVERYLTGPDTQVYQEVSGLKAGDVIDITGYLYWYEGPNTHIISIDIHEA